jgi:hypothetical protein
MFVQLVDDKTNSIKVLKDQDAQVFVPLDPHNPRYKAYLAWVAAGNSPTVERIKNVGA